MAIYPRVSTALFLSLFLLTACGGSRQNSLMSNSTCGSSFASQGVQVNQVTAVNCSSTTATSPAQTGYTATPGSSLPAMQTSMPVPGSRAVATANGYTYQQAPVAAQNNPYAGAYFPTGSYGTGYGANTGYGSATQGIGYIQYNVNQAQRNQVRR